MENGNANSGPIGGSNSAENVEAALGEAGGVMNNIAAMIENREVLDSLADRLQETSRDLISGESASMLRGEWLGHALHPILTDLPIGFWTSAMAVDLVGGRKGRKLAKRLIGLGILSAVPTALSGLADFAEVEEAEDKRVGAVHMVGNSAALGLFAMSWWKRTRNHHFKGMFYSGMGAAVATASATLGGHLVYNRGLGRGSASEIPRTRAENRQLPSAGFQDRQDGPTSASASTSTQMQTTTTGASMTGDSGTSGATAAGATGASNPAKPAGEDEFINLTEASERLGQPEQQVMALTTSGVLPNRGGTEDQPRFRVQDVEAVRMMGG